MAGQQVSKLTATASPAPAGAPVKFQVLLPWPGSSLRERTSAFREPVLLASCSGTLKSLKRPTPRGVWFKAWTFLSEALDDLGPKAVCISHKHVFWLWAGPSISTSQPRGSARALPTKPPVGSRKPHVCGAGPGQLHPGSLRMLLFEAPDAPPQLQILLWRGDQRPMSPAPLATSSGERLGSVSRHRGGTGGRLVPCVLLAPLPRTWFYSSLVNFGLLS
nr:uncharacterized protein LOC110351401 [Anas platyrhynchos]